jgi:hypothetical protein
MVREGHGWCVPTEKKQGRLRGRLEVGHSLSGREVSELLRQHRGVSFVKAADGCVFRHVFVVQEVGKVAAPGVGGLGLDRGRSLRARLGEPPRMPKRNKLVIVTVSALDDLRESWRCQRKQTSG